jgi:ribosomal protein S7
MSFYLIKSNLFLQKKNFTQIKKENYINFYDKFLGFLIKKGNKLNSKKILENAFSEVSKKTGFSKKQILILLFRHLNCFVETRKILIKRRVHLVPFSIKIKRRLYLIVKWLIKAIDSNQKKLSTSAKMSNEILAVLKKVSVSKVLSFRKLNNQQSFSNRSNIHFRW